MKSPHATLSAAAPVCAMLALESRRMLAVDLIASATSPAGFYTTSDLIEFDITLKNQGTTSADGSLDGNLPSSTLLLSKDKIVGNADDIADLHLEPILTLAAGASETVEISTAVDGPAGDYYIVVVADSLGVVGESNENNNTFFSPTASLRLVAGELSSDSVIGTAGNDIITIEAHGGDETVTVNGASSIFPSTFDHIFIDGGTGNDRIFVTNNQVLLRMQVTGGGGNDIIIGSNVADELSGANGKDKLFGGLGDDYMLGSAANDYLSGEGGNDTMSGAGGNDRLADVVGLDNFLGGAGNDTFICRDPASSGGDPDTVSGGSGTDKAQINASGIVDLTASIEEFIP